MAMLNFKGKAFVQNYHLQVKYHQLIPRKEKSLTDKVSLHDNLIIHGDNLKALKALLPTYAGKIKCIYIDPPYNTGNEKWAYNDNVNSPMMQDWLGKVVDKEDLTRHDKWLCMMTPRLKLLRDLLHDEGVIFVSIDDIEVHQLRMLMDEIFGQEKFLAEFIWHSRQNVDSRTLTGVSIDHEYVLCYARNENAKIRGEEIDKSKYKNPDNDPRGPWMSSSLDGLATKEARPNLHYTIVNPNTGLKYNPSPENGWRFQKSTIERLLKENRILWPKNPDSKPRFKRYLNERSQEFTGFSTILDVDFTVQGTRELRELMGEETIKFPKPVSLIKRLISQVADSNSIILDSFAGSGPTAHAVLALNKEDGGNRRFILVECEDYADKITAERVRRVIKGVKGAKDENLKKGLGGTFSYFDLGPPIEMESILDGSKLPSYKDLARYVFYTATGEEFDEKAVDEKRNFIGQSREYLVYLFYKPDIDYLKATALTLDKANALGPYPARRSASEGGKNKRRLIFAPTKYLDQDHLDQLRIDFAQLPFEIYKLVK
jgi:adenine-specific DNA-methyltransferase